MSVIANVSQRQWSELLRILVDYSRDFAIAQ